MQDGSPVQKQKRFSLRAEKLVEGGRCLARLADGRVVLVSYAIPGEEVVAEVESEHDDYLLARTVEVLKPSPLRREPPCPYFGPRQDDSRGCGGCQLQHIDYAEQVRLKTEVVREQLRRIGKLEAPVAEGIPAPQEWHYRNHARFTVRRKQLGFVTQRPRRFLRIDSCRIMAEPINQVLAALQDKLPRLHQVAVRYGVHTGEMLVQPGLGEIAPCETGQPYYHEELSGRRFRIAT